MPQQPRTKPPRPGPNARRGGFPNEPFPTIYVKNCRPPKVKKEPFNEPRSVAEVYGNSAIGEMSSLRAKWRRWEERKVTQRKAG